MGHCQQQILYVICHSEKTVQFGFQDSGRIRVLNTPTKLDPKGFQTFTLVAGPFLPLGSHPTWKINRYKRSMARAMPFGSYWIKKLFFMCAPIFMHVKSRCSEERSSARKHSGVLLGKKMHPARVNFSSSQPFQLQNSRSCLFARDLLDSRFRKGTVISTIALDTKASASSSILFPS